MKKILIVEDEPAYLKLLQTQLAKVGYKVVVATNGKEGLKKAESVKPDLVLLDIRMPVMSGMSMLDQLRKESWGKEIKVIILTNLEPDNKITGKVLRDQPLYYFVKSDIKFTELITKIDKLLTK